MIRRVLTLETLPQETTLSKRNEDQAYGAAGNSAGEPAIPLQHNIRFIAAGKPGASPETTDKVIHRSNPIGRIEFEVKSVEGLLLTIGQAMIDFKKKWR